MGIGLWGEAKPEQRVALVCRIEQRFRDKPEFGFVLGRQTEIPS
jgi:hypothetical protein